MRTKSKLSKLYEKYGQLQYCIMTGEAADEEELKDTAEKIAAAREKAMRSIAGSGCAEIIIGANDSLAAETVQRTKETIQKEMEKASAPKQETEVETTVADENDAQE